MRDRADIHALRLRLEGALAGRLTAEEILEGVRGFITEERGRIEGAHREGAKGREIVARLTDLADVVIQVLFREAELACGGPKAGDEGCCALVALGGYGRRELNPASDVDLMLLFPEREDPYLRALTDYLFHMLVNLRFELGYAFRSIDDCLELADADHRSLTSMLEARFLIGQQGIFDQFQKRFRRFLSPTKVGTFIEWKLAEQERRHKAYEVSLGEPNVKESPGGLRDLHTARWIVQVKFGVSGFEGLRTAGLLTPEEMGRGLEAFDFLLRVRTELHYLCGKHDVLSADVRDRVAANLGFAGPEPAGGAERLLTHYSLYAKEIHLLCRHVVARALGK